MIPGDLNLIANVVYKQLGGVIFIKNLLPGKALFSYVDSSKMSGLNTGFPYWKFVSGAHGRLSPRSPGVRIRIPPPGQIKTSPFLWVSTSHI